MEVSHVTYSRWVGSSHLGFGGGSSSGCAASPRSLRWRRRAPGWRARPPVTPTWSSPSSRRPPPVPMRRWAVASSADRPRSRPMGRRRSSARLTTPAAPERHTCSRAPGRRGRCRRKLTAPTSGASQAIGPNVEFGGGVALSADGNTAMIGGFGDNSDAGAVWVYTRGPSGWSAGQKLVAPEHAPPTRSSLPASSVATSRSTPPEPPPSIGGVEDHGFTGAAWSFTRPLCHGDHVDRATQVHSAHHRRRSRSRRRRLRERHLAIP